MKDGQRLFYDSEAWKNCREAYRKSRAGLCERCLRNGVVRAGRIVHHKIHLDESNIADPNVTLNWDNLELVCMDCHAAEHGSKKRFTVDPMGNVQVK